ncbi:MAG TPA: FxLYD domain-containing protein [Candidatus Acidoferrum sp.]|nr:FxLYD domain-containing protein [Candidatus Acidoferrum sp.]
MPGKGSTRIGRRRALFTVVAAVLGLLPDLGRAQAPLHLAYTVERGGAGPARVSGRVLNESSVDVFDVYVSAEALDASGKVLGRGLSFVSPSIPPRGIVPFTISIPAAQTAASFRVRISSFRQGFGQQAG